MLSATRTDSAASVCIKMISLNRRQGVRMAERELWFHTTYTDHPDSIVRIADWFVDLWPLNSLCIVMSCYVSTLGEFISRVICRKAEFVSPTELNRLYLQIRDALLFLESVGVVHRDVHNGNILWRINNGESEWKLTDFGSCSETNKLSCRSFRGNILTAAPELLKGDEPHASSDIWSFGCVLWECITLHHPFSLGTIMSFISSSKPEKTFTHRPSVRKSISRKFPLFCRDLLGMVLKHMIVPDCRQRALASNSKLLDTTNYQMNSGIAAREVFVSE